MDAEHSADIVLVSTPDLLSFVNAIYLPNPVDTEYFSARKNI